MVTFVLLAVILAVDGDRVTVDKGLIDGLREGDRGSVGYTVTVNGKDRKTIEVGQCEVVEARDFRAVVRTAGPISVRPGWNVRLALPVERVSPASLMSVAQVNLERGRLDEASRYLARIRRLLPDDALTEELAREIERRRVRNQDGRETAGDAAAGQKRRPGKDSSEQQVSEEKFGEKLEDKVKGRAEKRAREDGPRPAGAREDERQRSMIWVRGGIFEIGAPRHEARFYNQQPRFKTRLEGFWIDREDAGRTGYSGDEAAKYCRERGKRLPSEFEIEVAVRRPGFAVSGHAEWTSSWYLPYPGNQVFEKDYGEKFRVVRGPGDFRIRTFMLPGENALDTTFRCACNGNVDVVYGEAPQE